MGVKDAKLRNGRAAMSARVAVAIALLLHAAAAFAQPGWDGPTQIFSAEFGPGPEQIGREAGSIVEYDRLPSQIFVADDGAVLLADSINQRVVVVPPGGGVSRFGSTGVDLRAGDEWPGSGNEAAILPDGATIVILHGRVLQRYARDGALIATRSGVDGMLVGPDVEGRVAVQRGGAPPVWDLYDAALERVASTTTDPTGHLAVELETALRIVEQPPPAAPRRVRDLRIRTGDREITVSDFPFDVDTASAGRDGAVSLVLSLLDPERTYRVQTADGSLSRNFGVPFDRVVRIGPSGAVEAFLDLPATEFEAVQVLGESGPDAPDLPLDPQPIVVVGGTTVDANGNVYAFRRDATTYRLLKWTRR